MVEILELNQAKLYNKNFYKTYNEKEIWIQNQKFSWRLSRHGLQTTIEW